MEVTVLIQAARGGRDCVRVYFNLSAEVLVVGYER